MNISQVEVVDDCYESMFVRDLLLEIDISMELIKFLADFGKLIYEDRMERPYFKVICKGRFTLKGVLGNRLIRVVFPDEDIEKDLEIVIEKVNSYEP